MYHTVYLEFKTLLIDTLLTLTAYTRSETHLDYAPGFDYSWFKCVTQKVKGSVYFNVWNSWLLTVVAIHNLRFTLIKV